MNKIKDFGEKIGGAKKDLWKIRGLIMEDTRDMTEVERSEFVKRDNIWPKIKEQELIDSGVPRLVVYWQKEMRKVVVPNLKKIGYDEENVKRYIEVVTELKNEVMAVHSKDEIIKFGKKANKEMIHKVGYYHYYTNRYEGILKAGKSFLRLINSSGLSGLEQKMEKEGYGLSKEEFYQKQYRIAFIDNEIFMLETDSKNRIYVSEKLNSQKRFYYPKTEHLPKLKKGSYLLLTLLSCQILQAGTKEECMKTREEIIQALLKEELSKKDKSRKKKWMPPQLAHIKRDGEEYRNGINVSGDDFIKAFGIRGGEFGNWTNEHDRQMNLNMAFDAFLDLAAALDISRTDISLPGLKLGSLAIAFGSRGVGNAMAHYEMGREVINLTKMRGAGSLAHEWGHGLDDLIGKKCDCAVGKFASGDLSNPNLPKSFVKLMLRLHHDEVCRPTNYLIQSKEFGEEASKSGHGYWDSPEELFARAFACYVKDKLFGRNDYLVGHAESCCAKNYNGEMIYAYPIGEERKCFNQLFDDLIMELKTIGYFHEVIGEYQIKMPVFHMSFPMESEPTNFEQLTLNFENSKLF